MRKQKRDLGRRGLGSEFSDRSSNGYFTLAKIDGTFQIFSSRAASPLTRNIFTKTQISRHCSKAEILLLMIVAENP